MTSCCSARRGMLKRQVVGGVAEAMNQQDGGPFGLGRCLADAVGRDGRERSSPPPIDGHRSMDNRSMDNTGQVGWSMLGSIPGVRSLLDWSKLLQERLSGPWRSTCRFPCHLRRLGGGPGGRARSAKGAAPIAPAVRQRGLPGGGCPQPIWP